MSSADVSSTLASSDGGGSASTMESEQMTSRKLDGDHNNGRGIDADTAVSKQDQVVRNECCVLAFYQFFSRAVTVSDDDESNTSKEVGVDADEKTTTTRLSMIERQWRDDIESVLRSYRTYGMIRISIHEGMNGTICFPTQHLDNIRTFLHRQQYYQGQHQNGTGNTDSVYDRYHNGCTASPFKIRISYFNTPPFHRLAVRIKKEIVTMGPIPQHWIANVDDHDDFVVDDNTANACARCFVRPYTSIPTPHNSVLNQQTGIYVPPGPEWDELLFDPQCLVIDTRNDYEIQMGTFHNAISPQIHEFTEFPLWLHDTLQQQQPPRYNKIAMFCTGGIRCEKATALCIQMLLHKSSSSQNDNHHNNGNSIATPPVYHLEGGILAYLETNHLPFETDNTIRPSSAAMSLTENNQSDHEVAITTPSYGNTFVGECFVFDQRVAVTYGLRPTEQYISCHACRRPVHIDVTTTANIDGSEEEQKYQKGICCPACHDENVHGGDGGKKKQHQRHIDRQRQFDLAAQKLKPHIYDAKYI